MRRTSQPAVAPDASCQCFELAGSADQFSAGGCCRLRHGHQRTKEAAGAVLGYGRVSREGQDLAQQRAALRAAGCARLFEEKASGGCNSTRRSQSSDPR